MSYRDFIYETNESESESRLLYASYLIDPNERVIYEDDENFEFKRSKYILDLIKYDKTLRKIKYF